MPSAIAVVLLIASSATADLQTKQIVQDVGLDQHLDAQLPRDVIVRDEAGKQRQLGEFFTGKPVIVNFVYFRCPMLCTQVLNGVMRSSQAMKLTLGEDYEIVSISIDPRETPTMAAAKKKTYVASYRRPGAQAGWHFVTADEAAIERLTQVAGFRYRYDAASDQYAHASGLIVATPRGRISRYYYGIDYNPTDLQLGLVESSENRIGSLADQVLLLCYHYDPATGKYGVAIDNLIRAAGLATMAVLGVFLFRMYRLEQRRTADVRGSKPCFDRGRSTASSYDSPAEARR
jgi:protein SCO1/2